MQFNGTVGLTRKEYDKRVATIVALAGVHGMVEDRMASGGLSNPEDPDIGCIGIDWLWQFYAQAIRDFSFRGCPSQAPAEVSETVRSIAKLLGAEIAGDSIQGLRIGCLRIDWLEKFYLTVIEEQENIKDSGGDGWAGVDQASDKAIQ